MRNSVSFAAPSSAPKNHHNSKYHHNFTKQVTLADENHQRNINTNNHQIDSFMELSGSRFSLPTLSSTKNNQSIKPSELTSSHVGIPSEVEEIQKLTPRQRIKLEFNLQHRSAAAQPPSHLFGSSFDRESEKRSTMKSREGFKTDQQKKKLERDELKQSLRLSRSNLAMSMSLAIERGLEERAEDPAKKRPSPWVKNEYGADRHVFQLNWADTTGAPLPTIPQKWSAPGPGSYGGSSIFGKYDPKMLREALKETKQQQLAEEEKKRTQRSRPNGGKVK